jgi:hypothetical protein
MTKRVLATIGSGMVAAALIVIGGGCSGTDSGTAGTAGGGGVSATGGSSVGGNNSSGRSGGGGGAGGAGGAATSPFQAASQTICTTTSSLNCPNDLSLAACTSAMAGAADLAVEMGCSAAVVKALYDCWAASQATDWACDSNGQFAAKSGVCSAEQAAADAC